MNFNIPHYDTVLRKLLAGYINLEYVGKVLIPTLLFATGFLAVVCIAKKNNDFYTNYPTPLPLLHATLTIRAAGASP
jgi:hypothetical protein